MGLTSTEFFINIKNKPTPDSSEYEAFFKEEELKLERGIIVNGIYYPPWLYWHLNHWKILKDWKDPITERVKRKLGNPDLRDNEWIIAEHIQKAETIKKGLLIVGSRKFAKTEISASYIGYNSIVYFGSENMYAASNEPDVNKITSSLKRGYKALHSYFRPVFLEDTWKPGKDVVLGFKDPQGNRYEYSRLLLRNHDDGRNTEGGAGPTLNSFLIDEIGKSNWLSFFDAVKPAFESEFGWRCSPIATGTTGNMEQAKELEIVYRDMETYNFIAVELKDEEEKKYSFFPGMMSLKFPKKEIKLRDYLNVYSTNEDIIKITKWKEAREARKQEVKELEKKGKQTEAQGIRDGLRELYRDDPEAQKILKEQPEN